MLYACDLRWWTQYGAQVDQIFAGERWTSANALKGVINWIDAVDEPGLSTNPSRIHTGGNGGYQLVGLTYHWGVSRIVLLGYDMQRGPNGETHHHGKHDRDLPNPAPQHLAEWARRMIDLGVDLRERGVAVINATRSTAITCFEKMPIEAALGIETRGVGALKIPRDLLPREHAAFTAGLGAAGYGPGAAPRYGYVRRGGRNPPKPETGRLLVAENGYLNGPDGPYVALALDGHNGAGRWPERSGERFKRLGVDLKPWREAGGHILVCPSRGIGMMPQPEGWTERTVAALRAVTKREIRVRPHPGNWKLLPQHPDVSLARDLEGAWACVIWASAAGIKALVAGVPVIYTAPHWICAGAAGNRLDEIEAPRMPDRLPVFERLASAQWTLLEIESGGR